MPATFNGTAIFGLAVVMTTGTMDRESQFNTFFGLGGREVLDGGDRGNQTDVTGILFGPDLATFLNQVGLFRSYQDGFAYVLVDTAGTVWLNVRLLSFRPVPPRHTQNDGSYWQQYQASFEHLF